MLLYTSGSDDNSNHDTGRGGAVRETYEWELPAVVKNLESMLQIGTSTRTPISVDVMP
jgi:hypothetical protein